MKISNEERRNMANSLRHDAAYGEGSLFEWWGRLQFIVLDEEDFPNPKEVFEGLADLIDRPTTTLTEDEDGRTCCANCGCAALYMSDAAYCPDCGAEVVE